MHFSVLPNWAAPLSTGHPFGLPETTAQVKSVKRVPVVSQQSTGDPGVTADKSPPPFRNATADKGELSQDHAAPPSIMQLKISELLSHQAQRLSSVGAATETVPKAGSDQSGRASDRPEKPEIEQEKSQALQKSGYEQLSRLAGAESPVLEDTLF